MPIEEVSLTESDNVTLASKLLDRQEHWTRELCSIYPYGLNDSVFKFGNISRQYKNDTPIVVYRMFNKHDRKYRNRMGRRIKTRPNSHWVCTNLERILLSYNSPSFSKQFRAYIFSLPRRKLRLVLQVTEGLLLKEEIPGRIAMLATDLVP